MKERVPMTDSVKSYRHEQVIVSIDEILPQDHFLHHFIQDVIYRLFL